MANQPGETEPDQPFGASSFGKVFTNPPVPHVPENTLMFEAGPITIGVEYRLLNEEILAQVYGAERAAETVASALGESFPPAWPTEDIAAELSRLPPGRKITTPPVLFRKIEDAEVAEWTERFGGAE